MKALVAIFWSHFRVEDQSSGSVIKVNGARRDHIKRMGFVKNGTPFFLAIVPFGKNSALAIVLHTGLKFIEFFHFLETDAVMLELHHSFDKFFFSHWPWHAFKAGLFMFCPGGRDQYIVI